MAKENLDYKNNEDEVFELDAESIIDENAESVTANHIASVIHDSLALVGAKNRIDKKTVDYTISRLKHEVLRNSSRFEVEKVWPQVKDQIQKFQKIELLQAEGILRQLAEELKIVEAIDLPPAPKAARPDEQSEVKNISIENATPTEKAELFIKNIISKIDPKTIAKKVAEAKRSDYQSTDHIQQTILNDCKSELEAKAKELSGLWDHKFTGWFSDEGSEKIEHTIPPQNQAVIDKINKIIAYIDSKLDEKS